MNRFAEANLMNRKAKDINLKELLLIMKSRLWIIIVISLMASLLGAFYSLKTYTPIYQSSARIIIGAEPEYRNTLQVIIKDSAVLEKVVNELGINQTPDQLAGKISVTSIDNTQVVSIGVTDSDPNRAAKIADTVANVFKNEIPRIAGFDNVRLLSEATINPWPINQNQNRLVLASFVIGLVLGIGTVFLLDSLDETIRTNRDVEVMLGLPVLGRVSMINKKNLKKKYLKQVELELRGETIGFK
ncbi:MAG TPA: Wzz/FepE/Etk N-terminal domain-containing protein [Neobacillus sp.]|jgi:capsular polysaccharide biosynthesis protein